MLVLTLFCVYISSVQSLSQVLLFVTPWTAACQASLSITNTQSPPKPMSTELVMPSNHLTLCCPLLLLPSIFPSTRVFSNESALHMRWPKYWSFSFSISPSSEHSGLISFRMDWLDLLAVQGTLMSLIQHHSSKASTLQCSAFFIVQLSHRYMTIGKNHSLDVVTLKFFCYDLLGNITASPGDSDVKNLPVSAGDVGLITVGGTGNPLQNPDLGNPMNRRTWWAAIHSCKKVGHNLATKQQQLGT